MKQNLRSLIKKIPIVGPICKFINRVFLQLRKPFLVPSRQLKWRLRGKRNLVVLQIGSNDGLATDPLHDLLMKNRDWKAFLLEPVPSIFEKLKTTYKNRPNTFFLNVAVSDKSQTTPFYFIDNIPPEEKQNFPDWFDQLGSFNREHISSHLGHAGEKHLKTMQIPTVSLEKLFTSSSIDKLDVLHIDTEGHDWIIIKQLDLDKILPQVILIENKHLTLHDDVEFRKKFQNKYEILNLGTDYLCYLKK